MSKILWLIVFVLTLLVIAILFSPILNSATFAHYARADEMTPKELVVFYAKKYDVSQETMTRVINCENSGWDIALQSRIIAHTGFREESWGLVQIHLPSHPEVKKEQATNAGFSIEFLAKNLADGRGRLWSCF